MNFSVTKENIIRCLKRIQGVTERSSITPITANALIEAKKGKLIVSATNFEEGINRCTTDTIHHLWGITGKMLLQELENAVRVAQCFVFLRNALRIYLKLPARFIIRSLASIRFI